MQIELYFTSMIVMVVVTGWLGVFAWQQRSVPGARAYAVVALGEGLLALTEILSMLGPGPAQAHFWYNMRFVFTSFIPVFFLIFVLEYQGRKEWLSVPLLILAFIIPVLTLIIVWVPALHGFWVNQEVSVHQTGLFWISDTSTRIPGLWFLVHSVYAQILLLIGIVILLELAWRKGRTYRVQALLLSFGGLITLVTSLIPSFNLVPPGGLNPFIPGLAASSLLYALAIFRFDFLKHPLVEKGFESAAPLEGPERRSLALIFLIFVVMSASLCAVGYLSYQNYERQFRAQVEGQLSAIAALKLKGLENWRLERLKDGETIRKNEAFASLVQRYFEEPGDAQAQRQLKNWLDSLQNTREYNRIFLLDPFGVEKISSPQVSSPAPGRLAGKVASTLKSGQVTFLDFHRLTENNSIHLAVLAPLYAGMDASRPLGVLVFDIDPAAFLYPYLQEWPTVSTTAETLLFRREGTAVLFLNPLRFNPDAALSLRIPLTENQVLAVRAVQGQVGVVEGIDYRGASVIGDIHPVPDSPWFLVSRMDTSEVYAPMRERLWQVVIFIGALIAAGGAGLGLVWRLQQVRFFKARSQDSEMLHWHNQYLSALQETTLELLQQLDPNLLCENIIRRAGQLAGTSSGYLDLVDPETGQLIPQVGSGILAESLTHQVQPGESVTGTIWQTGQPLLVNDYEHWPGRVLDYSHGVLASLIGVPLLYNGKVLGVLGLGLGFDLPRRFEQRDIEILTDFARLAVIAIVNARLYTTAQKELAERKRTESLIIARLSLLEYSTSHSLDEILQETLDQVGKLCNSSVGFYHFLEKDQKTLTLQAWSTRTIQEFCRAEGKGAHYPVEKAGVWADCVVTKKPLIHNDYASLPNRKGMPEGHAPVSRELVVPILRAGLVVAILGVGNKPDDYTQEDADIVAYFADVAWEIAERKRTERALQESESYFRNLFNAMGEGLALHKIIYSTSGEAINYLILDVNPAYERILGVKRADVINHLATDIYKTPEAPYLEEYVRVASTGQAMFFESYFAPMDKHFRIVTFSPGPNLFATVFEDISLRKEQENRIIASHTELQELLNEADKARRALLSVVEDQKIAEEEIRRLNTELERRVADRTAQLEASNQELEAFAYSVSHDLRAPLRAIDGFSRILQDEYHQKLDEEGLRLIKVLQENTTRMDDLITGLLALSRVGRSEIRYTSIDMTSMVNSICQEQATPQVLKKFVFKVTALPTAYGDPTLIRQVWTNLISNAIKYTLPKTECVIEITGLQKDGQCTYSIKDSGVGFNPRYTSKLFGVFQRLHKASDFEGTGVGLAIVQRIIHLHGGRAWGEGQSGVGATFHFTIPQKGGNRG